jgi:hypothetical protein
MADSLLHYYNRFDPSKNYERLMFRSGYVLQGAELNEIQSSSIDRLKRVADAIFKDGDLIKDGQLVLDPVTGAAQCAAGSVYLRGTVRTIDAKQFSIPIDKTVIIGIYLLDTTVTELQDPSLRDPAQEVRNYQEPGAGRLQVATSWGWQAAGSSDGQAGEFYPVYTADYGVMRVKVTPPELDSVSQAIARYDRDSTGGDYVVSGLKVTKLADSGGVQQYSIDSGSARVNGYAVELPTSRRLPYPAAPELRLIDSEPWLSAGVAAQRVTFDRTPVNRITQVRITAQKVADIIHGSFLGSQDPLPDGSIVELVAINQGGAPNADLSGFTGGTTYTVGVDYKLTGQKIDWSLDGVEPNIGSSYKAIYRYITTVAPTDVDGTGFTVAGAVAGSLILTSYEVKLPRIDRLCITQDGSFQWIAGTSTDFYPVAPQVPSLYLPIARVDQNWDDTTTIQQDGSRVVPMSDIEQLGARLDVLTDLIAQQRLTADANSRSAAAKKGLFVDPFTNDSLRDAGVAQTAAIVGGELVLPITGTFTRLSNDVVRPVALNANITPVLEQTARTGSMAVNPYSAFDPIPATLVLNPPADHYTESHSVFTSDATAVLYQGSGVLKEVLGTTTTTKVVSSSTRAAQYIRQIDVTFSIDGFSPNENLSTITFDGIPVAPVAV